MKIKLESHFQSGESLVALEGTFPNFQKVTLAHADECTWQGDVDATKEVEIDESDPRPLFHASYWGVSSLSYESAASPLNEAARALCSQPVPKGWTIIIPGKNMGGAYTRDTVQKDGTIEDYVTNFAAGREPSTLSPQQKKERYEQEKSKWVKIWNDAGLCGPEIWNSKIPWAKEKEVISLAETLAAKFVGESRGKKDFEELNSFRSPLSHPRTRSAELMAKITIHSYLKK